MTPIQIMVLLNQEISAHHSEFLNKNNLDESPMMYSLYNKEINININAFNEILKGKFIKNPKMMLEYFMIYLKEYYHIVNDLQGVILSIIIDKYKYKNKF